MRQLRLVTPAVDPEVGAEIGKRVKRFIHVCGKKNDSHGRIIYSSPLGFTTGALMTAAYYDCGGFPFGKLIGWQLRGIDIPDVLEKFDHAVTSSDRRRAMGTHRYLKSLAGRPPQREMITTRKAFNELSKAGRFESHHFQPQLIRQAVRATIRDKLEVFWYQRYVVIWDGDVTAFVWLRHPDWREE